MKIKPLKIMFEPLDQFYRRAREALKKAIEKREATIQPKDVILFASVESYQRFMSDHKYAILAAIYKYEPTSVYQLAKLLHRPPQNVARDCDLLEQHGFIRQKSSTKGRKLKRPLLAFDYNAIIVYMPAVTYTIDFEAKAA